MNFLAHMYLSGTDPHIIAGNFIGDFVKGNTLTEYDPRIQTGIRLHREIDHFTDNHPIVLTSKKKLWTRYHHYAPVIVDIFYDHILAKNWSNFHQVSLEQFSLDIYGQLSAFKGIFPPDASRLFHFMSRDNWLLAYGTLPGIDAALKGMAGRTSFDSGMENASDDLRKNYELFSHDFYGFFPDLQKRTIDFLTEER